MHTSANTRGASVLGVLMLLGILSSAAILFDSASGQTSQVAAGATIAALTPAPQTPPATTQTKTETANVTQKCTLGYDYIVRTKNGKVTIEPTLDGKKSATELGGSVTQFNQCQTSGETADGGTPKILGDGRQCSISDPSWECKYYVCVPATLTKEGKSEECGKYIHRVKVNGSYSETEYKQTVSDDVRKTLKEVSPERAAAIAQAASGQIDNSFSQGLFNSMGGQDRLNVLPTEINEQSQKIAQLEQLARNCSPNTTMVGFETSSADPNCSEYERQASDERNKLEILQRDQKTLEALAKNQMSLAPPPKSVSGKPEDGTFCLGYSNLEACLADQARKQQSSAGGGGARTSFGGSRDPFGKFFEDNTGFEQERRELEAACRYGNQSACQRLAGGGYGAYGAAPSQSNRCGSSQSNFGGGLGGIIGGIISIFSKNNSGGSNCVDSVPRPQCTLTASPTNIATSGQQVTLSWQSNDAFAATLSSGGSVGVNGSQVVQPQQTTTYTLSLQGYRNTQTGQVLSGQCSTQVVVGGTGTSTGSDPKAQIACSPQGADVGMSVAVSYSCLNSNTSSGSGFSTNSQLSGSATPVVTAPSIGSDTVTYGLTCSKEGKIDSAQCTVKVNKTAIVLVANPKNVKTGAEVNIGWVTSGMQSCAISSPQLSGFTSDNAGSTSVSGVVRTPPLTNNATFILTCTSRSGATKTAETRVEVGN